MARRFEPSEPVLRAAFRALAILHLGIGAWLFLSPHTFFTTVGAFGSYNRHYERDVSTFYFAFALGAWVAARRPGWRVPVLTMITLQYAVHSINHGIDVNHSHNGWAGPVDLVSLALAAVQFTALLWLLTRSGKQAPLPEPERTAHGTT